MKKIWEDRAWDEYLYWQTQDKKTLKKINSLISSIERTGRAGQAELLKGDFAGWSSARIDQANRLVYKISGDKDNRVLTIAQCKNHMNVSEGYASQYRLRLIEQGLIAPVSRGKVEFAIPMTREYIKTL